MAWYNKDEHEGLEYEEDTSYSNSQLEHLADQMLREYGKKELCRDCLTNNIEVEGQETGQLEHIPQFDDQGKPVVDEAGNQLILAFPEIKCENEHQWYKGEGKSRTHGGRNAILFEEHLIQRKRREIYTTEGVPDPNIVSGLYNRCVDIDTEILTSKGWKRLGELKIGNLVWSYNIDSDRFKWCPLTDLYYNDKFKGRLYSLESMQISARVTEGHRWAAAHERDKGVLREVSTAFSTEDRTRRDSVTGRILKSEPHTTLSPRHYIPLARAGEHPVEEDQRDLFELLGWVISDGGYKTHHDGMTITQALHNPKLSHLIRCLEANGLNINPYTVDENNVGTWYVNTVVGNKLREFAPLKKISSIDLSAHSRENLHSLLYGVIYGDGSLIPAKTTDNVYRVVFTTSRWEADAIQALCTILGITTSLTWRYDPSAFCPMEYFIYLKEQKRAKFAYVRTALKEPEYYEGTVWCPTVETGYWMARRNGKPYVTGNSHPQGRKVNTPAQRREHGASYYR